MKKWWRIVLTLGTLILGVGFAQQVAHAEGVGYTVSSILPDNQDDKKVTYFALRVKPNQKQKLAIVISNTSKEKKSYQVGVNQAITNSNGVIDYSKQKPERDSTLKVGIKDIFGDKTQKVTIPGKSKKKVYVTYKMPPQKIEGMILGGIYVKQLTSDEAGKKGGVSIKNAFAYVIGVRLRESDVNVAPDMKLLSVKNGQFNQFNQVEAKLQNPRPGIMSKLKVKAKVTKQGDSKVILNNEKSSLAMAPNSHFNYAIPWGDKQLKAGTYTLTLDAYAQGGYHWHFTKDFELTTKEVGQMQNKFNTPKKTNYLWWFVAGGAVIILLLLIIIYLLLKNRRRDDNDSSDAE